MTPTNPKQGEYWMTAGGSVFLLRLRHDGDLENAEFPKGGAAVWNPDGSPWMIGSGTDKEHGPLTHRVNPDGTAWKGEKQVKPINYQRLAKRMSLAPSIREARKIYNNSVKGKK